MSEKWKVFWIMMVAVLLAAFGEALASRGMKDTHHKIDSLFMQIKAALLDWHVLVGIALMIGYVLLYVYTLGLTELSFALPLSASSYLIGVFLSKYYLGEEIKPARWIGTLIIIAGVLVVAAGGSGGGGSSGSK